MKICILSIGRSGSTSLYNAIKRHLSNEFYCISEPFNHSYNRVIQIDKNQFEVIESKENVLIKTIINHKPDEKDLDFFNDWIFTFFDKVILLDRLDKKSQIESFSFLMHTNSKSWHKKQYYEMSTIPQKVIDEWDLRIDNYKLKLSELSKKFNKKIFYYEDIFLKKDSTTIKEIFDYLEIKIEQNIIDEFITSENHKVRLDKKNNKLI